MNAPQILAYNKTIIPAFNSYGKVFDRNAVSDYNKV